MHFPNRRSKGNRIPLWGGGCGKLARDLVRIGVCVNRSASPPRSRSGLSATGPPAHVPARRLPRQRPLAPRGPGPFDAAGREVELAGRQLLYPERVHEWIGNIYLDDFGRDSPASLNSTGDM